MALPAALLPMHLPLYSYYKENLKNDFIGVFGKISFGFLQYNISTKTNTNSTFIWKVEFAEKSIQLPKLVVFQDKSIKNKEKVKWKIPKAMIETCQFFHKVLIHTESFLLR